MRQTLREENLRKETIRKTLPPIRNGNAAYHLELKNHAESIKAAVFKDKLQNQPSDAVLELNSRDGRKGVGALRRTVRPMPLSAADEADARATASALLEPSKGASLDISSSQNVDQNLALNIRENSTPSEDAGEQFLEFSRQGTPGFEQLPSQFDVAEPDSEEGQFLRDRQQRLDGIQGNRLLGNNSPEDQDRLLTTFGVDPNSKIGSILKECIPCGRRSLSLDDIEFSNPFAQTLEDLKNKYAQLLRMLNALTIGDQFEEDLCDLLRLWNAQCIPDLFGIISLLGILYAKYTDAAFASWRNFLNSLIGPFLTPIIGPLVHNLERYIDMIVDPLVCVVEALEAQMYKLDAVGGANQFQAHRRAFNRKKIEFYDAKINSLQKRQRAINTELSNFNTTDRLEIATNAPGLDGSQPVPGKIRSFPRNSTRVPFTGTEFDPANNKSPTEKSNFITRRLASASESFTNNNPRDVNLNDALDGLPGVNEVSFQEELSNIDRELVKLRRDKSDLEKENTKINDFDGGAFKRFHTGAVDTLEESREQVEATGQALKSIIYQITLGLNQGIQVVRDSLDFYRQELERTILGRVSTQEDQVELARTLQQIQRWISIVNALIKLKQNGWNLEEMCNRGNNSDALGAFVGQFKTEPTGGNFNFFKGTDPNGNELLVVAPGGAQVNVTSVDFEDVGSDDLLGDVQLEDVQNTATFNDLNEADELNRRGVLADLGNIGDSDITITLDDATDQKSSLDLRAERSYVIIKNDFCSKSPLNVGSADKVRQWAETL